MNNTKSNKPNLRSSERMLDIIEQATSDFENMFKKADNKEEQAFLFGMFNLGAALFHGITHPNEKVEIQGDYYKARWDYRKACERQNEKLQKYQQMTIDELYEELGKLIKDIKEDKEPKQE